MIISTYTPFTFYTLLFVTHLYKHITIKRAPCICRITQILCYGNLWIFQSY